MRTSRFAVIAVIAGLGLSGASAVGVVGSAAQAAAPTSAYAVIGTVTLPVAGDQVAVDLDDDTVYVGSYGGSAMYTLAPGSTSGSPLATLALPGRPSGVVVDDNDDTVYVWAGWPTQNLWVTAAGTAPVTSVPLGMSLQALTVNSADDTVYGSSGYYFGDDSFIAISGTNTDDSARRQGVGWGTYSLGVDQQDDTVWVAGMNSNSVNMINGATLQVTNVPGTFGSPRDLVVDSINHLAYVASEVSGSQTLQKVNASGPLASWSDPSTTGTIMALSLDASGSRAVFKTGNSDDSLWMLDTTTMQPEGPGLTISGINETAQASSGLIYVARYGIAAMSVVAEVQGVLSASTAQPGDALTISVTSTPALAAGQPVVVDDSTLSSVSFGGFTAAATRSGPNTFTVTVPSGPTGTVEAVASLNGGTTLSLGNVSFGGAPAPEPAPAVRALAPRDVTAAAEDGSATVSWSAPESTGTFPISHYMATSLPGGDTCLVRAPVLSCEVSGLANGTAYTFTVQALTGAGWSTQSSPSNAVVPRASANPTIVITGTREGKRISVTGRTTGLAAGTMLTPHVARSLGDFSARVPFAVGAEGSVTWSRRASASVVWRVYVASGDVKSNTVTIR